MIMWDAKLLFNLYFHENRTVYLYTLLAFLHLDNRIQV